METQEADAETSGSPPLQKAALTVILVERDRRVRDLVSLFLRRAGYLVELADTGNIGLDCARRVGRGVVITEILVPELDGLALCRLLKEDPTIRVGVLVLSMLAASQRAQQAGADAFLCKPVDEQRLVATVRDIAAKLPQE